MDFDPTRYLLAKRSVDDRALNRVVLDALRVELARLGGRVPRVLELGAGVGTMPRRLFEWGVLAQAEYTLVDADATSLELARQQLAGAGCPYSFAFAQRDLFELLALSDSAARYDLVIANAVLDLVELPRFLPLVLRALGPGRPLWFSINFDGDTVFVPEHELDREVLGDYHRSMDERARGGRPAGHSQTGRRLLRELPAAGAHIVSAGSSDWVVWPEAGSYRHDEAYFLHCILETIERELRSRAVVEPQALATWARARRAQIERGELCYVAHQLDILGRAP